MKTPFRCGGSRYPKKGLIMFFIVASTLLCKYSNLFQSTNFFQSLFDKIQFDKLCSNAFLCVF